MQIWLILELELINVTAYAQIINEIAIEEVVSDTDGEKLLLQIALEKCQPTQFYLSSNPVYDIILCSNSSEIIQQRHSQDRNRKPGFSLLVFQKNVSIQRSVVANVVNDIDVIFSVFEQNDYLADTSVETSRSYTSSSSYVTNDSANGRNTSACCSYTIRQDDSMCEISPNDHVTSKRKHLYSDGNIPMKSLDYELCDENQEIWTTDMLIQEAKKYKSHGQFSKRNSIAYHSAHRLGILNSICAHMKERTYTAWSDSMLYEEAKKYSSRDEFNKKNRPAYHAARYRGTLNKICSRMTNPYTFINRKRKIWTFEMLRNEALKYMTRTDFNKGSSSAYIAVLVDICQHMPGNITRSPSDKSRENKHKKNKKINSSETLVGPNSLTECQNNNNNDVIAFNDDNISHMVNLKHRLLQFNKTSTL